MGDEDREITHLNQSVRLAVWAWAEGDARRANVVIYALEGSNIRSAAVRFGIAKSMVQRWVNRFVGGCRASGLNGVDLVGVGANLTIRRGRPRRHTGLNQSLQTSATGEVGPSG